MADTNTEISEHGVDIWLRVNFPEKNMCINNRNRLKQGDKI